MGDGRRGGRGVRLGELSAEDDGPSGAGSLAWRGGVSVAIMQGALGLPVCTEVRLCIRSPDPSD